MDPVVSVQNKNISGSQIGSLKSFTLTIRWNLAKLVKIFPGIKGRGISPGVIRLSNFKDVWKERVEHSSLSRGAIGERLFPDVKSSFFWVTNVEIA